MARLVATLEQKCVLVNVFVSLCVVGDVSVWGCGSVDASVCRCVRVCECVCLGCACVCVCVCVLVRVCGCVRIWFNLVARVGFVDLLDCCSLCWLG